LDKKQRRNIYTHFFELAAITSREKDQHEFLHSLGLWPLVDVEVGQRDPRLSEELVHAQEVAVERGQHDLRSVAPIRNCPRRKNFSFPRPV